MTSTTTTTTATTLAVAVSATCTTAAMYELPVKDAACGIPNRNSYKVSFESCAQPATVSEFYHGCSLWAPAIDQSVQELIDCLYGKGVEWGDVWCSGNTNATASGTMYPTATSTPNKPESENGGTSSKSEDSEKENDVDHERESDTNGGVVVQSGVSGIVAWGVLGLVLTEVLRLV